MKILFISRAFPPVIGGIENQNRDISEALPGVTDTTTIANRGGKRMLPLFLPYVMIRTLLTAHRYDAILLGDGVLGVVAWWIRLFQKKTKIICITHGLDLTYVSGIYQMLWIQLFLPSCDHFIAVGNQTIESGVAVGLPRAKFTFIPNGINPANFPFSKKTKEDLWVLLGEEHRDKNVILTSGRLVERKGVAWFIRNVLPTLPEDIIYAVASDGPDRTNIESAIEETDLTDRVILLGFVSDEERETLFAACDVFVQPNIPVEGDMEGFGISVIEAAVSGIPVIAADLEGLRDAIADGENGWRIPSGDACAWREKVTEVLDPDYGRRAFGLRAREHVITHNSWEKIIVHYVDTIRNAQ